MPDRLFQDFETFSKVSLPDVGADVYSKHPSTKPLMLSYAFNSGKVEQWVPAEREPMPRILKEALLDPDVIKTAWNMSFEWHIYHHCLGIKIPIRQTRCTMTLASTLSLPMQLEKAGQVLGIPAEKQKLADGKKLIRLFSQPIKPTKRFNTTRAHHLTHPEDWDRFKLYNRQDIEAERAIWQRIRKWDMPDHEWDLWFLDQRINQRGIPVNLDVVENACRTIEYARQQRFRELEELTGLDNPGSRDQLLGWLRNKGYPYYDLQAGHVKREIEELRKKSESHGLDDDEEEMLRVLTLRAEISRTSVDKFFALERATAEDGNLRNAFQFAGAGRTWRWSGRIYQPQNLARPSKEFEAPEAAIAAVTDLEKLSPKALSEKYPKNLIDLISACVRPVVQAPDGYVLIDADLNAIENRVLGWMADDRKILKVFKEDRDPYVDFATYMYGASYESLMKEYKAGDKTKRTIAKPGVLGCLASETPVLTQAGWKAIIELEHDDLIFDGRTWVSHSGVVYKGVKEVLCGFGVYATEDHKFLVGNEWKTWQQVIRPQTFAKALDTANGVCFLTKGQVAAPVKPISAGVLADLNGLSQGPILFVGCPPNAPAALLQTVAPISENESGQICSTFSQIVSTLRARVAKTRKIQLMSITGVGEFVCGSRVVTNGCGTSSTISEPMEASKWIELTTTAITKSGTSDSQLAPSRTQTSDTWDVVDAGPENRFMVLTDVGPVIAHNCGYMLSAGFFYEDERTGEQLGTGLLGYAANMGVKLTPELAQLSVDTWRSTYTDAVDFWYRIERAMMKCVATGQATECWPVRFDIQGPMLRMILPSGRALHYVRPRIETKRMPWGKEKRVLTYEGLNDKRQWARIDTHPGKITENADQAISRDALAHGMKLAEKEGIRVRLHVHDQIAALVPEDDDPERDLKILTECMSESPPWGKTLPLKAVGTVSKYFLKD